MDTRTAIIKRKTNETDISVELNLAEGEYSNNTDIGFFDHMLDHLAKHGGFSLQVEADGDVHIDDHHTVEDTAIALGQAFDKALGDKKGIERFGFGSVPMDDALAQVSIDISGRAALSFSGEFKQPAGKIGEFDVQLVREFFNSFAQAARMNLHIEIVRGENDHHIAEAIFKATARALKQAIKITGSQIPSTKGVL